LLYQLSYFGSIRREAHCREALREGQGRESGSYDAGVTAFDVYLVFFLAGVGWGLDAGFGATLFARKGSPDVPRASGRLRRTFLAALVTGFGGSGALLTRSARWGAPLTFDFALLTGILFAALVATATRIVLEEERRPTSP
jgi:hypothetical protein